MKTHSIKYRFLKLKNIILSLLSLLFIIGFVPFGFYRSALDLVLTQLSEHEDYKKFQFYEQKFHDVSKRFYFPIGILVNYAKSFSVSRDSINLNLSLADYEKLNSRILLARQRGFLNKEDKNIKVNATLVVNNSLVFKSKVRLKGTNLDHAVDDKWSFRIKLKNNQALYGMNRFSLHNPGARMWLTEWLYHKALKYSDLMYLEYKFLDFYINGKFIGAYALEEFMHANLIEKNRRRDGILLKGSNALFNQNKIETNKKLENIYKEYRMILSKYEKNEIKVSDFYDLEKLAKHFAITQIFGSGHSHLGGNWITYYNPLAKKVEVIGFDSNSGRDLKDAKLQIEPGAVFYFKDSPSSHLQQIFRDKNFIRYYIFYIIKFSQKEYFRKFFDIYKTELLEQINIIRRSKPWHVVDQYKEIIYENQKYILKYFSKYINDYNNITNVEILNFMEEHSIEPNKYNNLDYKGVELINQNGNISKIPFVKYNHQKKIARITEGNYTLNANLIIPPGITFIIDPGVTLYLDDSSTVISYSNMQLVGNKQKKIKIISVSPSNSLVIFNAKKKSKFDNVIFENLSENALNKSISGSVTIHESEIDISNSLFSSNRVLDDQLNIIRSKFRLINTQIIDSNSDGVDIDFSEGFIDNLSIINSNNDGIDFSNSVIQGSKLFISSSADKGVSVGENSQIEISDSWIEKSKICLAVKDSSYFTGSNLQLLDAEYGVALYNKKFMYGLPKSEINNVRFKNVGKNYFLEQGAILKIDNKIYDNYSSSEVKSNF